MVGHAPAAVCMKVSGAVIPQADVVEIFDIKRRLGHGGRKVEKAVCYRIGGKVQGGRVDVDVGGVGLEEVKIVVEAVALVRTS